MNCCVDFALCFIFSKLFMLLLNHLKSVISQGRKQKIIEISSKSRTLFVCTLTIDFDAQRQHSGDKVCYNRQCQFEISGLFPRQLILKSDFQESFRNSDTDNFGENRTENEMKCHGLCIK